MSQQNVEIVRGARYRISLPPERVAARRTPDERLFVRFPALYRFLTAARGRLPVRSRLRRRWTARAAARAAAAANRRDFDVLLLGFDQRLEYHPMSDWMEVLDLDAVFHDHAGYREVWRLMTDAFEDFRLELEEVIDLGDHLLASVVYIGHGSRSGVPVRLPLFQLFRFRDGLVVWQRDFEDRASALEAVRLSEQDAHAGS
jgi:ketosteroid isomerase-like protein